MKDRITSPALGELSKLGLSKAFLSFIHILDKALSPSWEFYIKPHLNGLRPDLVILNPYVGVSVFQFYEMPLEQIDFSARASKDSPPQLYLTQHGNRQEFPPKYNPIEKLFSFKREMVDLYCLRLKTSTAIKRITSGVVFPFNNYHEVILKFRHAIEHRTEIGRYPQSYPILCKEHLNKDSILKRPFLSSKSAAIEMGQDLLSDLRSWLKEPDFSEKQRRSVKYDARQMRIINNIEGVKMRRMKGPAGTGKTAITAARAKTLASEGKSVLIVVYNITLIGFIRDLVNRWEPNKNLVNSYQENITYFNFHNLCKRYAYEFYGENEYRALWRSYFFEVENENLNSDQEEHKRDKIFEDEIPSFMNKLIDSFGKLIPRYDAILIDEGQDFNLNWWNCLRRLLKADGEMLLAADSGQDIYGRAKKWTEKEMTGAGFPGNWLELKIAYRLPPALIEFVRKYLTSFLEIKESDLPESEPQQELDLYPCKLKWVETEKGNAAAACEEEILAIVPSADPSILSVPDVVLVSQTRKNVMEVVRRLGNKGIRVIHTVGENEHQSSRMKKAFYLLSSRVKATTIHSFKGLETRSLIVHIEDSNWTGAKAVVNTAITRLKRHRDGSYITIVNSSQELLEFGKSFPDYKIFSPRKVESNSPDKTNIL
jgi:hypothetical protein